MPPPKRQHLPTQNQNLEWVITDDDSRTLWRRDLDETYHSGCGAVAESLHVYLLNSHVGERLDQQRATTVLEYGLGTATAFCLTAGYALLRQTPLRYLAIENALIDQTILSELELERALRAISKDDLRLAPFRRADYVDAVDEIHRRLLAKYQSVTDDFHLELAPGISLHCAVGNAQQVATVQRLACAERCDAVYFDPFSPESNPELWTSKVFEVAREQLRRGGILTSYCVKSRIRTAMAQVGFEVTRRPGPPGGKREVLTARKL